MATKRRDRLTVKEELAAAKEKMSKLEEEFSTFKEENEAEGRTTCTAATKALNAATGVLEQYEERPNWREFSELREAVYDFKGRLETAWQMSELC